MTTHEIYYQVFYRESEGGEWCFWENRYSYADAESGAISLFKSEKTVEVEVFEIVADQKRKVFSAYRDKRGYIYGQREDEIDRERKRRMRQEQQERQRQQEEGEQKRQQIDTGYSF